MLELKQKMEPKQRHRAEARGTLGIRGLVTDLVNLILDLSFAWRRSQHMHMHSKALERQYY